MASNAQPSSRGFTLLIAVAGSLITGVLLLIVQLWREGAAAHVWGLIQQLCTSLPHVIMDLTSLALAGVVVVVFSALVIAALATWRRTSLLVACMLADRLPELPVQLRDAARSLRIQCDRVIPFSCPDLVVFAHGFLRPRILISSAVIDQLTADELEAVLAHEAHHLHQSDPLRRWTADVLARGLFLFPVVADLRNHFVLVSEIDADDTAIRTSGRESLAAAIVKFAHAPQLTAVAAITSHPDGVERIAHVVQEHRPMPRLRTGRLRLAVTIGNVALIAALAALLSYLPSMS